MSLSLRSLRSLASLIASEHAIRRAVVLAIGAAYALLSAYLVVGQNGNPVISIGLTLAIVVALLTVYRLDWGFYILLALVYLSDGYEIIGFGIPSISDRYLVTLNVLFRGMGFGVLSLFECHLLFFVLVWIVQSAVRKHERVQPVPLGWAVFAFAVWLVTAAMIGRQTGGDFQMALWEIRSMMYFAVLYFLIPQVLRSRQHVRTAIWILIGGVAYKAWEALIRFGLLGFSFSGRRTLTNHEDALFFVLLLVLLVSFLILHSRDAQLKVLRWLIPLVLFGFYLANRRAAYAAFAAAIILLVILLEGEERRNLVRILGVFGIVFALYLVLFWNSYGRLAVVASAVKSVYLSATGGLKEVNTEDYMSTIARDQENYNLAVTYRLSPLTGIGFGKKHEWAVRVYGAYALKGYLTHNQILWLLTKAGAIGFFLFFGLVNLIAMRGGAVFRKLRDPYYKVVCIVAIVAVFGQVVVSYVDMQLTYARNMVNMALLTSLIPIVERLDKKSRISDSQMSSTE